MLATVGGVLAGLLSLPLARALKKKFSPSAVALKNYDPTQHKWLMCVDVDRCIGCGLCADACKTENQVPEEAHYFRTWVERYIIRKPAPGADAVRGEVLVDSPNGGRGGFPPTTVPREDILKSFFVPKLCNLCEASPCTQVCPVGATFDAPDGAVLVDPAYCIGCGFCIQACPYGCRFLNPKTNTAEKCTLCYHRIVLGLKPACVEICPTQARVFGDVKNPVEDDPLQAFVRNHKVHTLKPHLGTSPRLLYANLDKEVR
ncbi:MAG: 4Fe-4S dicluster domain-containing protein [Verrucomicrobia bacterium]|nr:4Fe-4S dicluster domain-containing protein [Verrucomicrobiota bacterium]